MDTGVRLNGLIFSEEVRAPSHWVRRKGTDNVYFPVRHRGSMADFMRFEALPPMPNGVELAAMLGIDFVVRHCEILVPEVDVLPGIAGEGRAYLLTLPAESEVPEGVTVITEDEYFEKLLQGRTDSEA
jgi:hypothetical protein